MADFAQVLAAYQVRLEDTERSKSAEKFLDNYRRGGQKHMCRMKEGTLKCVGVWDTVGALGLREFGAAIVLFFCGFELRSILLSLMVQVPPLLH